MKKLSISCVCIIALVALAAWAPNVHAQECTVDADCDDGQFCNGAETCDTATGTCQAGTPVDCDDGVVCTVDTCDEVNDACVNTPDDANCDDYNVCNGIEICDPLNDCQPGTPLDCDDQNLCTTDSCDPVTGCANVPVECTVGECDPADGQCKVPPECTVDADCDDGQFCNGAETCDTATGTCQAGTPVDCDDGVVCTVDTCDEVNDACVNTPDDANCTDDGLFCTGDEICDPAAGCVSTGDPCPEGTTCNENQDICDIDTTVEIDIKPGSDPNSIKCNNANIVITVAILTTDDFDATTVDHETVSFEGDYEIHVNNKTGEARRHEEDVDGDGDLDLVFHFLMSNTNLTCYSTEGTLIGELFDGLPIEGTDAVRMIE